MLHPSTQKLIDRLAEMTSRGKLNWTEGEHGAVVYATEGYGVTLTATPVELVIHAKDGKELERATSEQLNAAVGADNATYASIVAAMRVEAARLARGTEAAISTLLAGIDLDGDGIPDIPAPPPFPHAASTAQDVEASFDSSVEDVADESHAISPGEAAQFTEASDGEELELDPEPATEPAAEPAIEPAAIAETKLVSAEPETVVPAQAPDAPVSPNAWVEEPTEALPTEATAPPEPEADLPAAEPQPALPVEPQTVLQDIPELPPVQAPEPVAAAEVEPAPATPEPLVTEINGVQAETGSAAPVEAATEPVETAAQAVVPTAEIEPTAVPETIIVPEAEASVAADAFADEEPDMTAAVARLADEVNARSEAALSPHTTAPTAPEQVVHTAAMPEPQSDPMDAPAEPVPETAEPAQQVEAAATPAPLPEAQPELKPEPAAEPAPVADAPHTYVPFGLEASAAPPVETELFVAVEQTIETVETVTVSMPVDAPDAVLVEPIVETRPVEAEAQPELPPEPASAAEPVPVLEAEPALRPEPDAAPTAEIGDQTPALAPEPAPVQASVPTPTPAAQPPAPQSVPQPVAPEAPRSYSLSAIGAGLEPLTARTEATGVPGRPEPAPQTRLVIDATDDVVLNDGASLAQPSAKRDLPDLPDLSELPHTPTPPAEAAVPVSPSEAAPASPNTVDEAAFKPKTRFNPWN